MVYNAAVTGLLQLFQSDEFVGLHVVSIEGHGGIGKAPDCPASRGGHHESLTRHAVNFQLYGLPSGRVRGD